MIPRCSSRPAPPNPATRPGPMDRFATTRRITTPAQGPPHSQAASGDVGGPTPAPPAVYSALSRFLSRMNARRLSRSRMLTCSPPISSIRSIASTSIGGDAPAATSGVGRDENVEGCRGPLGCACNPLSGIRATARTRAPRIFAGDRGDGHVPAHWAAVPSAFADELKLALSTVYEVLWRVGLSLPQGRS